MSSKLSVNGWLWHSNSKQFYIIDYISHNVCKRIVNEWKHVFNRGWNNNWIIFRCKWGIALNWPHRDGFGNFSLYCPFKPLIIILIFRLFVNQSILEKFSKRLPFVLDDVMRWNFTCYTVSIMHMLSFK